MRNRALRSNVAQYRAARTKYKMKAVIRLTEEGETGLSVETLEENKWTERAAPA
jgi:hypothetical protein